MVAAMAAEEARGVERQRAAHPATATLRVAGSLAAAAAVGLFFYAAKNKGATGLASYADVSGGDELLGELVAEHARPLPFDATDPTKVRTLEQYVGVPVSAQAIPLEKSGARFVGGRVLPVHRERAALLQYEIGAGSDTRRVSVFVFDPRRIQVNAAELTPKAVGTAQVHVGRAQGYSVAVTQNGGVGYALATDLDDERSAQLAAMMTANGTGEE
jgi:hypothetical protein